MLYIRCMDWNCMSHNPLNSKISFKRTPQWWLKNIIAAVYLDQADGEYVTAIVNAIARDIKG